MHRNVGHQYRVGRKAENSQEGQDSDTRDFCANRQKTNNLTTNVNSGGRARDLNHDQHDLALDRLLIKIGTQINKNALAINF